VHPQTLQLDLRGLLVRGWGKGRELWSRRMIKWSEVEGKKGKGKGRRDGLAPNSTSNDALDISKPFD